MKNVLNLYKGQGKSTLVWRICITVLYPILAILQIVAAVMEFRVGSAGGWWNVGAGVFVLSLMAVIMWAWHLEDASRARTHRQLMKLDELIADLDRRYMSTASVLPRIPSSETLDPRYYAAMRSLETGEPLYTTRGDDGVWRNSATGEPLPVQGEVRDV